MCAFRPDVTLLLAIVLMIRAGRTAASEPTAEELNASDPSLDSDNDDFDDQPPQFESDSSSTDSLGENSMKPVAVTANAPLLAFSRHYVETLFDAVYPTVRFRRVDPRDMQYDWTKHCRHLFTSRTDKFYRHISRRFLESLIDARDPLKNIDRINYNSIGFQRGNLFAELVDEHRRTLNRMDELSYVTTLRRHGRANQDGRIEQLYHVEFCLSCYLYDNQYRSLFDLQQIKDRKMDAPLWKALREMGGVRMWIYSKLTDLPNIPQDQWANRQMFCQADTMKFTFDTRDSSEERRDSGIFAQLTTWWLATGRRNAMRHRSPTTHAKTPTLRAIFHHRVESFAKRRGETRAPYRFSRSHACLTVFDAAWIEPGKSPPSDVQQFRY